MQHSIIVTLPAEVKAGDQVLVRVYLDEPGWRDGAVEVDLRKKTEGVWTPASLLDMPVKVRNEGVYKPVVWELHT